MSLGGVATLDGFCRPGAAKCLGFQNRATRTDRFLGIHQKEQERAGCAF